MKCGAVGPPANCSAQSSAPPYYDVLSLAMRFAAACLSFIAYLSAAQQMQPQQPAPPAPQDYSGMYSFLREGEFIQFTVDEKFAITGFISRFGDSESDRGVFLNQFFKSGKLTGNKVVFTTEVVHGNSFSFEGNVERGPGKSLDEEGYYVLRGTLTRNTSDSGKTTNSQNTKVEFRSFPRDTN
jgi:hypothetical protein